MRSVLTVKDDCAGDKIIWLKCWVSLRSTQPTDCRNDLQGATYSTTPLGDQPSETRGINRMNIERDSVPIEILSSPTLRNKSLSET